MIWGGSTGSGTLAQPGRLHSKRKDDVCVGVGLLTAAEPGAFFRTIRTWVAWVIVAALFSALAHAQVPTLEERVASIERQLRGLNIEIPASNAALDQRIALLEAKMAEVLARSGGKTNPTHAGKSEVGLTPVKTIDEPMGDVTIEGGADEPSSELRDVVSGYAEFRYGNRPGVPGNAGVERFVLYFGHRFSPRLRFSSAIEVEPSADEAVDDVRKIVLGQAYLDFLATPRFSVRAGILLAPIGIINEKHEPTSFNGVNRPLVETFIIPSGWRDAGVGVTGQFGQGWRYRAYVMGGLNAARFAAADGIRGGRQGGQIFTNLSRPAQVGRVEYLGIRGLQLGASGYTSGSGFELKSLNPRVNIGEIDGQYGRGRFHLRALFARVWITQAGEINKTISEESGRNPNVASQLGGWYIEPSWNLFPEKAHGELLAFTRYERFNTQLAMPSGFSPIPEYQRNAIVTGLTYRPIQDVALKLDYSFSGNRSIEGRMRDGLHLGLGWYF